VARFSSAKDAERSEGSQPAGDSGHGDSSTIHRSRDEWLLKYDLDIQSATILDEDADKDGFSNVDEYRGADLKGKSEGGTG
jgi:hypothetical protein